MVGLRVGKWFIGLAILMLAGCGGGSTQSSSADRVEPVAQDTATASGDEAATTGDVSQPVATSTEASGSRRKYVDPAEVDRTSARKVALAVMRLLFNDEAERTVGLVPEEARKLYESEGDAVAPALRRLAVSWRADAVRQWDGSVEEIRYWRRGEDVGAAARIGATPEGLLLVTLIRIDGRWYFNGISRLSEEAFRSGSTGIPEPKARETLPALVAAAATGDAEAAKLLLQNGADPDVQRDGWTPLHIAAQEGHADIVRLLAAFGAEMDNLAGVGTTPLMIAIQNKRWDLARALMQAGADPDGADERGARPLHMAADVGGADCVRMLSKAGADINARERRGWTPLMFAVQKGDKKLIAAMLELGADATLTDEDGWTPLHLAAQKADAELAQVLLEAGAKPGATDARGWPPLMVAAQKSNGAAFVKTLLAHDADVNATESHGFTALMVASQYGHLPVVQALLEAGADVNAKMKQGATALDIAAQRNHEKVVAALEAAGGERGME